MNGFGIVAMLVAIVFLTHSTSPQVSYSINSSEDSQAGLLVFLTPSTVEVKVGGTTRVNMTVTEAGASALGPVCFSIKGTPSSEFSTMIVPPCATGKQNQGITAILVIQVSPATAPQKITATVLATSGTEKGQAELNITVVPAIPVWIPWLLVIGFIVTIGIALMVRPFRVFQRRRGYDQPTAPVPDRSIIPR